MLDLFGEPIEVPIRRGKVSERLGARTPEVQGTFAWAAGQPAAPRKRAGGEASLPHPARRQEAEPLDDDETELQQAIADLSLHGLVEEYLKDQNLSYVDVHEVHERLFSGAQLELFDFVVQAPEGHNWLLYAAPLSVAARDDLRQWEQVFGLGFHALVAEKIDVDDGNVDDEAFTLTFRTLDGERVELEGRPSRTMSR